MTQSYIEILLPTTLLTTIMAEIDPSPNLIPEEVLISLTVSQLKAELKSRGVYFPSKSLKRDLCDQLRACMHLPVVAPVEAPTRKKSRHSKSTKWNKDHPLWVLLHNEIKAGNIPLDASEMGPTSVYQKCSDTFEFQMEDMDFDTFIGRLHEVRQKVLNEEPLLPWNESHPARILLCKELEDGRIPVDEEEMGPAEVYCLHANTLEFNLRGMECSKTFEDRLDRLRTIVDGNKKRKAADELALKKALEHHPAPPLDHRGYPQWNGSLAQALLKMDISAGVHKKKNFKPSKLWADSEIYRQGLPKEHMRWRVRCEVRTNKCLHTLNYKADLKLRENLKDLPKEAKEKLNL